MRSLSAQARAGVTLPFAIDFDGRLVGQLTVSSITYGSLRSASIGYWVSQHVAGRGITPTAVALATDHCFGALGLHRVEINIRPENGPSLRVVEKLGFRDEGCASGSCTSRAGGATTGRSRSPSRTSRTGCAGAVAGAARDRVTHRPTRRPVPGGRGPRRLPS